MLYAGGMHSFSVTAFTDELVKTASPNAVQAMIDKKMTSFKPPAFKPPATPIANPMMPPKRTLEQRTDQRFDQIRQKAGANPSMPVIKTPRTVFGVRG